MSVTSAMEHLPAELIEQVLLMVPNPDIRILSSVCRSWHEALDIFSDCQVWAPVLIASAGADILHRVIHKDEVIAFPRPPPLTSFKDQVDNSFSPRSLTQSSNHTISTSDLTPYKHHCCFWYCFSEFVKRRPIVLNATQHCSNAKYTQQSPEMTSSVLLDLTQCFSDDMLMVYWASGMTCRDMGSASTRWSVY
jgi:hypothetical protein